MEATARDIRYHATYQDVLDAPEHMNAEIIDGELILSPRPAVPHATSAIQIASDLNVPFGRRPGGADNRPGGWCILFEPELHLADQVLVPDLAGWRRERMPVVPRTAFIDLAPDWVCEVVSPRSAGRDRIRKMALYAEHRISHVWLVDPLAQSLEVYRLQASAWLRVAAHEGAAKVRVEPFDAVELDLAEWWLPESDPPTDDSQAPPADMR